MSTWKPILKGPPAQKAWKIIEQLDRDVFTLEEKLKKQSDNSLAWAPLSASLFCYNLYRISGDKKDKKRAESLMNMASEKLSQFNLSDQLYGGFTRISWTTEHFRRLGHATWTKKTDPNKEVDEYFVTKTKKALSSGAPLGRYGLCDQWVGYGVYALERLPSPDAEKIIKNLVNFFKERGTYTDKGVAWFTTKNYLLGWERKNFFSGNYNIGVSHGNPGVTAFLSLALQENIAPETTRDLLLKSAQWLLNQDERKHFGFFVPQSASKNKIKRTGRLSWCYGDLGISMVLLNAARVLKDKNIEAQALKIAHRAAEFSKSRSKVYEETLCHGAFGAYHVFNRLYQATGQSKFLNKAQFWFREGIKMTTHPSKEGPLEEKYPFGEFDTLTGRIGVGLSLLAGVSKVQPEWDRLLLLS